MCEACVRYKKLYKEIAKCPIPLVCTSRCAQNVLFKNDWMLPQSSSLHKFPQNAVNAVIDRIVTHFSTASQHRFSFLFFDLLHPGLIYLQPLMRARPSSGNTKFPQDLCHKNINRNF